MRDHKLSASFQEKFSGETQHIPTLSLLRSMLPDGWYCPQENEYGIQSDGIFLRSSASANNVADGNLRMIRANRSIKISTLIPIVNSTRPEWQLDKSSLHAATLAPPSLSRQSSANSRSDLEYVYYFEVFLICGKFSVGFHADIGEERGSGIHVNGRPGMAPESIGLHVNGDLWNSGTLFPNWTQPFRDGDTIGCGVVVGTRAHYFFTRNGEQIVPGVGDHPRVSSTHTALVPCVGVSPSADTVIRTNFGFGEHSRFLWKGNDKVRILCHATPGSWNGLIDESFGSDEAFLTTDLVRGHTVGGETNMVPRAVVCAAEEGGSLDTNISADQGFPRPAHSRRHSDTFPNSRQASGITDDFSMGSHSSSEEDSFGVPSKQMLDVAQAVAEPVQIKTLDSDGIQKLDLDDMKELARELHSAAIISDSHHGALSQLVDVCRSNLRQLNDTVLRATMGMDTCHDLGELLAIHEQVTDAIQVAEKKSTDMQSNGNAACEYHDIIRYLIDMRGQKQKRCSAVWGLLRLTKRGTDDKICNEIIASGGMQSLLTLFKTSRDSTELMMVSALAAVYLLPSLLDSDFQSLTDIHMGVIECLQFLIQSCRGSTDIDISPSEIRTASAFTMTNLWFKALGTKLRSSEVVMASNSINRGNQDPFSGRCSNSRRRSSLSSLSGDDVDCSNLIDAFTSLSVMAAETEASRQDREGFGHATDMNVYYEFALIVESICALEYARPMAMKEGVLTLLLKWLRSGNIELERPAANALRSLTLTQSDYTAGWVHSQLLNENALVHIVERLGSGDSGVRLAMAEVILSLTVAPHTRAGIIQARGVKYLVQLLGSVDIQAEDEALALAAGNALLYLAMGTESRSGGAPVSFIIDDIIQSGALNTLVSMARAEKYGSLRFVSVKILRVISEECSWHASMNGTERQLCDAEAVSALGKILQNDCTFIRSSIENSLASSDTSDLIYDSLSNDFLTSTMSGSADSTINEVRHVLRGLVNILRSYSVSDRTAFSDTQLRACSQLISSGGVKSMLWVASLTQDARSWLERIHQEPRFCHDIQIDSCQALASLCPLLLSSNLQPHGATKWAPHILSALVKFLKHQTLLSSNNSLSTTPDVYADVLQGLGSLAEWEPLKTRLIDEFMPGILDLHRQQNRIVSVAATQVCLALGFNEAVSGANDAYLLGDKFILARSRLIQSMVRDEIRLLLRKIWAPALNATDEQSCENRSTEQSHDTTDGLKLLFPFLCQDQDTAELRQTVRQQFMNLYEHQSVPADRHPQSQSSYLNRKPINRTMHRSGSYVEGENVSIFNQGANGVRANSSHKSTHLMEDINMNALSEFLGNDEGTSASSSSNNFIGCHQYPLSGTAEEKNWVLEHCEALKHEDQSLTAAFSPYLRGSVSAILRACFPSSLIRDYVLPLSNFTPDASFNFRALAMPSGEYFSFWRETQLISEECKIVQNSEQVHFTLCFRNSSFAGEFTESLLKAFYLCPMIKGLSFSNTFDDVTAHAGKGSELLPFLARSIPSSVTHLTFDNVLSNNAALSLAHVLKNMYEDEGDEETIGSVSVSMKGSLHALAITNSPHINRPIFSSLVESINGLSSPLQRLRVLDLSGNLIGDAGVAKVLSIALSSSSSASITHLDLSRNNIGEGSAVKGVLQECMSNDPKLEVLNMSGNDFGEGDLAIQLVASLGDVLANIVSMDLSENDLSDSFLAALGGLLSTNCILVNLNVSNNQFSSSSVNNFLSKLHNISKSNVSTHLLFVHLGGNVPSLTPNQEMVLNEILATNRWRQVSGYREKQRKAAAPHESGSDTNALSIISDTTGEHKLGIQVPSAETITVLFSAPLVWKDNNHAYHPIEMLDFKLEKSLLWQCFSEASRNIDLYYDNATTDRLQAVMTRGFKCLHFSGHGHPYSLTFEDGSGGIHWFSVDQLKALISGGLDDGEPPFQFVFVSACHSALAGQTFVDSGVPHVVCCQQESQLMDSAALSFTRAFYLALAVGRTLKDSFEIGKHAVLSSATVPKPAEEMEKFMLLPEDGNHDVPIFNAEEVPEWPLSQKNGTINSSRREVNDSLPAPPQGFLGRETDMYHVLNLVLDRRFVNIVGPTGMGRSSLAAALCHYIDDRKSTLLFDDIYFVKSMLKRPAVGKSSPIITLHKLVSAGETHVMSEDADLDEIIQQILVSLKHTKSLLVFDKIETLDGTTEAQDFHFFLGQIFEQTKDVHVLVTSHKSIGLSPLLSVGESVYELGPLNFRNTVKFFAFHCPHLHSSRERKELVEQLASHTIMNRLTENDKDLAKVKSMLGGGVPSSIFAAAYEMTAEEFEEFKQVGEDKGNDENNEK